MEAAAQSQFVEDGEQGVVVLCACQAFHAGQRLASMLAGLDFAGFLHIVKWMTD